MIANRIGRRSIDQTSDLANPRGWLTSLLGRGDSYTGKAVTVSEAVGLDTIYAAIRNRSSIMGAAPLLAYRDLGNDERERAPEARIEKLFRKPNPHMTRAELVGLTETHRKEWGNSYWFKVRDPITDLVSEIWPLAPDRMTVTQDAFGNRDFEFRTVKKNKAGNLEDGPVVHFTARDITHIRDWGHDGLVGLSAIGQARQRIGIHLAQEEYQGRFYANGASPSLVIEAGDKKLEEGFTDSFREQLDSRHVGGKNWGRPLFLSEGLQSKTLDVPMRDQEFVAQRKLSISDAARIIRIPTWMLEGDATESMTYTNTGSRSSDVYRWYFMGDFGLIQDVINSDPDFAFEEGVFIEFNLDHLLRGDTSERYAVYAIGLNAGFLTVNEVRRKENMRPLPGGDIPRPGTSLAAAIGDYTTTNPGTKDA